MRIRTRYLSLQKYCFLKITPYIYWHISLLLMKTNALISFIYITTLVFSLFFFYRKISLVNITSNLHWILKGTDNLNWTYINISRICWNPYPWCTFSSLLLGCHTVLVCLLSPSVCFFSVFCQLLIFQVNKC